MLASEPSPLQVWAVDHESIQLTWGTLPAGPLTVTCGDHGITVDHGGGAGSIDVCGLADDTAYTIVVDHPAGGRRHTMTARTAPRPPGAHLARLATVNDLHLGSARWGFFKTMTEIEPAGDPDHDMIDPHRIRKLALMPDRVPEPGRAPGPWQLPHPWRCAVGAIEDSAQWGARLLVLKGDLAQHETEECFEHVGALVDAFEELPMIAIPGNHDVDNGGRRLPEHLGRRRVTMVHDVDHCDLPGLRLIVANSTIPKSGRGTVEPVAVSILDRARESDRPILLLMHHQLQPTRLPRYWPIGISAPESTNFLDELDRLSQPVVVSSGHTHRNRIRRHGSVMLTEVASTKDWPGVWAGYDVFEGGLVQTVRRTGERSVLAWQEYSRRAVGGLWAGWSPGRLDDRCLSVLWDRSLG